MKNLDQLKQELQVVQQTASFDKWFIISSQISILHARDHNDDTRLFLRQFYKQFIKKFINSMNNNSQFIKVCFKYAKMFKDVTELLQYFKVKKLGDNNIEFQLQLAQYYMYNQQNKQKAILVLKSAQQNCKKIKNYSEGKLDQALKRIEGTASYYLQNNNEVSQIKNNITDKQYKQVQFTEIQMEEMRLFDYFQMQIKQNKLIYANKKIKPYNQTSLNQSIITQMVYFLHPKTQFSVYYSNSHTNIDVKLTEPQQIPYIDQQIISYIEYINDIPEVIQTGQVLEFQTEQANNLLTLSEELGQGGFGRVYKAELIQNKLQFTIAAKFFIRKKDQIKIESSTAVSGSYLRELYSLAVLLYRATLLKTNDLMKQVDLPFTKLYCGLVGKTGNGAILMQYIKGKSLYDHIKSQSQEFQSQNNLLSREILQYFIQMLTTVQLVHQCDILHSDLKIDNWILLLNSKIILCDFGKAIDLQLFCQNDQQLVLHYSNLNPVSPSPACEDGFLFNADAAGLASCLFSLINQRIMQEDDIVKIKEEEKFVYQLSGENISKISIYELAKQNSIQLLQTLVDQIKQVLG